MVVLPLTTHSIAVGGATSIPITSRAVLVRAVGNDVVVAWAATATPPPADPCDLVLDADEPYVRLERPSTGTTLAFAPVTHAAVVYVVELAS